MAYSGTTTHYGLPKYVSTDKPSWLDTNDGFDAIDAALYAAAQAVDPSQIAQMQNDITDLQTNKQNVLTFDATPTNGSVNPVTSGGVYSALNPTPVTVNFTSAETFGAMLSSLYAAIDPSKITVNSKIVFNDIQIYHLMRISTGSYIYSISETRSASSFDVSSYIIGSVCSVFAYDGSTISEFTNTAIGANGHVQLYY